MDTQGLPIYKNYLFQSLALIILVAFMYIILW